MNETLTIRNFGPISDVTIHLKRANIIIGNQSTGKSTIAKLIDIFKSEDFLVSKTTKEKSNFFKSYGLAFHFNQDTFILYESDDYKIKYDSARFSVSLSKRLKPLIESYREINLRIQKGSENISDLFSQRNQVAKLISKIKKAATYFPTERNFVSFLPSITTAKNDRQFSEPDYITNFRLDYESSRLQLTSIKIEFLNLEFQHNKKLGTDFISLEGKIIPLQYAASGLQSLIPLYVVIERQSSSDDLEGIFLIEEPESNLFPSSQNELIKYITSKCLKFDDSFLLTTHSPYILTSLNNLMYAYLIGRKYAKQVNKIIDKKYWVNPAEVSAYQLLSNGTAENIIAEDGLIMAENIDVISKKINEEYDSIQDIKLGIKQ